VGSAKGRLVMKIYTVHVRPAADGAYPDSRQGEAVFVPEGFSWWAFLLQPLWAIYHRLWLGVVLIVVLNIAVALMVDGLALSGDGGFWLNVVAAALIGAEANDWRRRALRQQGYALRGIVAGDDMEEAERRYFSSLAGAR
jgi:hypothetical protein